MPYLREIANDYPPETHLGGNWGITKKGFG
jgi:hypothetical protein